jgi:hypothetical protein
MAILAKARTSNSFASCMRSATLWNEYQCFDHPPAVIQDHAINAFYTFPIVFVQCADLAEGTIGEALVSIRPHDQISLDYSLFAADPRLIAGTIVHEIMHARGMFRHEVTGRHYSFSVPVQAAACIELGRPNGGPCALEPPPSRCPPGVVKNHPIITPDTPC